MNDNHPHPVQTIAAIFTATFDGDNRIPGTNYGSPIPVKIVSQATDGDYRSVTVQIGNKMYPFSEIERLVNMVKSHKNAVKAW